MELLDIDVLELARQLTITESQLYQKIRPSECLLRSKESKTDHHDNIANFIRRSNRVSFLPAFDSRFTDAPIQVANWVAYAILCKDEPRRRASIMKHFISVADVCSFVKLQCSTNAFPIALQAHSEFFDYVSYRIWPELVTYPSA